MVYYRISFLTALIDTYRQTALMNNFLRLYHPKLLTIHQAVHVTLYPGRHGSNLHQDLVYFPRSRMESQLCGRRRKIESPRRKSQQVRRD